MHSKYESPGLDMYRYPAQVVEGNETTRSDLTPLYATWLTAP
jgi:hypothetical protein